MERVPQAIVEQTDDSPVEQKLGLDVLLLLLQDKRRLLILLAKRMLIISAFGTVKLLRYVQVRFPASALNRQSFVRL